MKNLDYIRRPSRKVFTAPIVRTLAAIIDLR